MEKTNNTTIETPIVIQIEQLKYTISKAIQDSKLPIFIINPILKDFFQEQYNFEIDEVYEGIHKIKYQFVFGLDKVTKEMGDLIDVQSERELSKEEMIFPFWITLAIASMEAILTGVNPCLSSDRILEFIATISPNVSE